ncbi:MAG: hypothetical protein ABJD07_09185 [Gemmatimonadaceae bacterium]
MSAQGWRPPLRFRGTPLALSAVTDAGPAHDAALPLTVELPGSAAHRTLAAHSRVGEASVLKMHLPRNTPPGSYTGMVQLGDSEQEIVLDVQPEIFLRLFPERITITARAGERVQHELSLANMGNVAVDVRGAYAFGMFDVGGMERAIAKTIIADPKASAQGRADMFADAVVEEHGGMVRLKVDAGAGSVAPNEIRELKITMTIPDRVRPGHTYWGTWPLHNLRYYVRITGANGAAEGTKS